MNDRTPLGWALYHHRDEAVPYLTGLTSAGKQCDTAGSLPGSDGEDDDP